MALFDLSYLPQRAPQIVAKKRTPSVRTLLRDRATVVAFCRQHGNCDDAVYTSLRLMEHGVHVEALRQLIAFCKTHEEITQQVLVACWRLETALDVIEHELAA